MRPEELRTHFGACHTPGDWLSVALGFYEACDLAVGQITTDPHDEALYLILHTLGIPLDADPSALGRRIPKAGREALMRVFEQRILERRPAAYITGEAWLNGVRFQVDERVLIPRSYFLELIPETLDTFLPDPASVTRLVDVCTGSGCLAILLAMNYPKAVVDAVDLSPAALEVARANVAAHSLQQRVLLHRSDVLASVPEQQYDVILSNPPYEPSALCDGLPPEFKIEPRMALDGGRDGLDIIRRLLLQSRNRLKPKGVVLIEVGGLRHAMEQEFSCLQPEWLRSLDGATAVCVIRAANLRDWSGQSASPAASAAPTSQKPQTAKSPFAAKGKSGKAFKPQTKTGGKPFKAGKDRRQSRGG